MTATECIFSRVPFSAHPHRGRPFLDHISVGLDCDFYKAVDVHNVAGAVLASYRLKGVEVSCTKSY